MVACLYIKITLQREGDKALYFNAIDELDTINALGKKEIAYSMILTQLHWQPQPPVTFQSVQLNQSSWKALECIKVSGLWKCSLPCLHLPRQLIRKEWASHSFNGRLVIRSKIENTTKHGNVRCPSYATAGPPLDKNIGCDGWKVSSQKVILPIYHPAR